MTGLYCQQVGVRGWTGTLNDRCATIPELLKQAGKDPKQDPAKMQAALNAGSSDLQPLGVTIDLTAQLRPKKVTLHNVIGLLPGAGAGTALRREVPYGARNSRADILLTGAGDITWIPLGHATNTEVRDIRKELLVFVTPRIVVNEEGGT